MTCKHNNVEYAGTYSLVGNYVCKDCNVEIDPVEIGI
jgi:transposase-like protein